MKKFFYATIMMSCVGHSMAAGLSCDPKETQIEMEAKSITTTLAYANSFSCAEKQNVCVVYDVDNTLLTAEPSFGGDSWAIWQSTLGGTDKNLVTHWLKASTPGDFEGALRYFITYHPVELATPKVVAEVQKRYPTIAMTARGFATYYAATKRQLTANSMDFSKNPIGKNTLDNTLLALNSTGDGFKMYYNGVYYTAGDDKGLTLLNFIKYQRHLTGNQKLCSAVVFADDNKVNSDNVANALKNKVAFVDIHLTTVNAQDRQLWKIANWELGVPTSQAQSFYTAIQQLNQ